MFTEYAYYDFKIIAATIRESEVNHRAYIAITWEDIVSGEKIMDSIPSFQFSAYKVKYYDMQFLLDKTIEDKDLQYLIGREDRLKVLYTHFKDRKFPTLDIKHGYSFNLVYG